MWSILKQMRHNLVGPLLIAIEIALCLAILSNALFLVHERLVSMARSTGIDESRLFAMQVRWANALSDADSKVQADLTAIRSLRGVVDAYVTNSYPLSDFLWAFPLTLSAQDKKKERLVGVYLGDSHALTTLGLQLIAGRDFEESDIQSYAGPGSAAPKPPGGMIITEQLAHRIAPTGAVLGRLVTMDGFPLSKGHVPVPITGIVKSLQVASVDPPGFMSMPPQSAILLPYRYDAKMAYYLVRTQTPSLVGPLMKATVGRLYALRRDRVLTDVESLSAARRRAYQGDRGQVIMLAGVSVLLLGMTAWGIVGLTSCWVNQRRRQIGIRRALGASHAAIVRHFQIENLLMSGTGVVLGMVLAVTANIWLINHFQSPRMQFGYVVLGAGIVVVLGQLATLWPALRAAATPPALAARAL